MKLLSLIILVAILSLALQGVLQVFASTDNSTNFQQPFIFPSPAYCYPLGYRTIAVPVRNTLTSPLTAIVFGVFHSITNEDTLLVSTSNIIVAGGQNQTGYVVVNLQSETYSVNVFVWSINGSSLSSEQANLILSC